MWLVIFGKSRLLTQRFLYWHKLSIVSWGAQHRFHDIAKFIVKINWFYIILIRYLSINEISRDWLRVFCIFSHFMYTKSKFKTSPTVKNAIEIIWHFLCKAWVHQCYIYDLFTKPETRLQLHSGYCVILHHLWRKLFF